jgi:hypothetical protein
MKRLVILSLSLAILGGGCTGRTTAVDFCKVLASAPEYEGHTFKTEIVVVPDYHGWFATIYQCNARAIGFASGSFTGSTALRNLDGLVESAYRTRQGPGPLKAVDVRVTARVDKGWISVPGVASPQPTYTLRLLDAAVGRLVDITGVLEAPESGNPQ